MKKSSIQILILLGYALPLFAGSMYLSYAWHLSILYFLPLAIFHGLLCYWGIKTRNSKFVFWGNLLGMVTNYLLWLLPHPEEQWCAYFKFYPSCGRMFLLLGISFAVQAWFLFRDYANRNWTSE